MFWNRETLLLERRNPFKLFGIHNHFHGFVFHSDKLERDEGISQYLLNLKGYWQENKVIIGGEDTSPFLKYSFRFLIKPIWSSNTPFVLFPGTKYFTHILRLIVFDNQTSF